MSVPPVQKLTAEGGEGARAGGVAGVRHVGSLGGVHGDPVQWLQLLTPPTLNPSAGPLPLEPVPIP